MALSLKPEMSSCKPHPDAYLSVLESDVETVDPMDAPEPGASGKSR